MSLHKNTPCDLNGVCPYESEGYCSCEYWCGADEPQDDPEQWEGDDDDPPGYFWDPFHEFGDLS